MSGTVIPPIPTYPADLRSLIGSQQGRAESSLGRDLLHLREGRGQGPSSI